LGINGLPSPLAVAYLTANAESKRGGDIQCSFLIQCTVLYYSFTQEGKRRGKVKQGERVREVKIEDGGGGRSGKIE
jgi:hypothetical protein